MGVLTDLGKMLGMGAGADAPKPAKPSPFGELTWNGYKWVTAPIAVPVFRGATADLGFYEDEIAEDEIAVLHRFLSLSPERGDEIVPHLWSFYCETRDGVEPPPPEISGPADIWRHAGPSHITVKRIDGDLYVSVEGWCDWEEEHGLQIVFKKGDRLTLVSSYNDAVTDGRAYGRRALDAWMYDPAARLPVRTLYDKLAVRPDRKG